MKFLGVSGVFDYAGLNKGSRYRPCSCCLPRILTASATGLYVFAAQLPTRLYPFLRFTESLAVSAQDSGPSGSLILSRKNFAFSASCRFSPARQNPHITYEALVKAASLVLTCVIAIRASAFGSPRSSCNLQSRSIGKAGSFGHLVNARRWRSP